MNPRMAIVVPTYKLQELIDSEELKSPIEVIDHPARKKLLGDLEKVTTDKE